MPRHSQEPERCGANKAFRSAIDISTGPAFEYRTYYADLRSDAAVFLERFVQERGPIIVQPTYVLDITNPTTGAAIQNLHTIMPHHFEVDSNMSIENIEQMMRPDLELDKVHFEQSGLVVNMPEEDDDNIRVTMDIGPRQADAQNAGNSQGSAGAHDQEDEAPRNGPGRPKLAVASKSFFIAIYLAIHQKRKPGSMRERGAWLSALRDINNIDIEEEVTQTNVVDWFKTYPWIWPEQTFIIYTKSGSLIYKRVGMAEDTTELCLCYDSTAKMWRYVYEPQRYFIGAFGPQCATCFNRHTGACEEEWVRAKSMQTIPKAKKHRELEKLPMFDNVIYADSEVLIDENGMHHMTHLGLFEPKAGKLKYILANNNDEPNTTPLRMLQAFIRNVREMTRGFEAPIAIFQKKNMVCKACLDIGPDDDSEDEIEELDIAEYGMPDVYGPVIDLEGPLYRNRRGREYKDAPFYRWKGYNYCPLHIRSRGADVKVYFHNLSGYDMHHLVAPLSQLDADQDNGMKNLRSHVYDSATKTWKTKDRYGPTFAISKGIQRWERFDFEIDGFMIEFKDSFKLLSSGLDGLIKDYLKEHGHMRYARKYEKYEGKLKFPYDWYDNMDKLQERALPDNDDAWYNTLTDKVLERESALEAFTELRCETVNDYLKHYLAVDVLGLADVVENFRTVCKDALGVDPSYFHGVPSMAYWNARRRMFSKGGIYKKYYNPTDMRVQELFYKNIRGGVTNAIKMYTPYITPGEATYVDVAGLYATAMRDYKMPVMGHEAKYEELDTTISDYLHSLNYDDAKGFNAHDKVKFMWIEFDYSSQELQDRDWQLPYIERRDVSGGLVNDYINTAQLYHEARAWFIHVKCGIPIVNEDTNVLVFKQDFLFDEFVSDNLRMRQTAIELGQKTLSLIYKLMNNASYGKTMENPSKYRDLVISENTRAVRGQFATLNVGEDKVAYVTTRQGEDKGFNTPHIGFTILEYSKIIFYDMWRRVHVAYGDDINLLYCDTDSMILHMPGSVNLWDKLTTDFPGMFNATNEKILGTWEKELRNDITGVIALSAKQYFVKTTDDGDYVEKHKGISRRIKLDWEDYETTYLEKANKYVEQVLFKRLNFNIITTKVNKIGLSAQNRKRVLVDFDSGKTMPLGYKGFV